MWLKAVVVHKGGLGSGHYLVYILDGGIVWCCNDAVVTRASLDEARGACASMLLYVSSPPPAQPAQLALGDGPPGYGANAMPAVVRHRSPGRQPPRCPRSARRMACERAARTQQRQMELEPRNEERRREKQEKLREQQRRNAAAAQQLRRTRKEQRREREAVARAEFERSVVDLNEKAAEKERRCRSRQVQLAKKQAAARTAARAATPAETQRSTRTLAPTTRSSTPPAAAASTPTPSSTRAKLPSTNTPAPPPALAPIPALPPVRKKRIHSNLIFSLIFSTYVYPFKPHVHMTSLL